MSTRRRRIVGFDITDNRSSSVAANVRCKKPKTMGDIDRKENFSSMAPNGVKKGLGQSSGGTKKLVIRNLKPRPSLPVEFEARAVEKVKRAVLAIQRAQPVDATLEELYGAVQSLCEHGSYLYCIFKGQGVIHWNSIPSEGKKILAL
jgi:hypothetical protein